ncbi:lazarillo protein-like [Periplaneta americana]|uniref:lazarillo protein-like n=1 Tax=Periplaneta americana TaxID=6978 RepID=UPI0037E88C77
MIKMLAALVTLFLLNSVLMVRGQSCNIEPNYFNNFNMLEYLGKWEEQYRNPNEYERYYTCEFDDYSLSSNDDIAVLSRAYNTSTRRVETSVGKVSAWNNNSFTLSYTTDKLWSQTYWVRGTDYKTYSIVSGCLDGESSPLTWIATRSKNPSKDVLEEIERVLKQYNMNLNDFERVDHSDCPDSSQ